MKFARILLLCLCLPLLAHAGVNLKNGNFYINYTDIALGDGDETLAVTRTYNSRAPEVGWFGIGWGSDYETSLFVTPEGGVMVHENGTGARRYFAPVKPADFGAAAQRVVAAMQAAGELPDAEAARAMVEKLKGDRDLRTSKARRYGVVTELPVGTVLTAPGTDLQVRRTTNGFERTARAAQTLEAFSLDGKLVRLRKPSGFEVSITYAAGRLHSISDNRGHAIHFALTPQGLVESLWSDPQQRAFYRYNGLDLVESRDVDGNRYGFAYDDKHNLTAVNYEDGSRMRIEYDGANGMVTRISQRDGNQVDYRYGAAPTNPELHYWTETREATPDGTVDYARQEYEFRTRDDGSTYLHRQILDRNGQREERIYGACCELPLRIVKNDVAVEFSYDSNGRVTERRSSDGNAIRYQYEPIWGKLARIEDGTGWTRYAYDAQGNLLTLEDHTGSSVQLAYDAGARIIGVNERLPDGQVQEITIRYGTAGKPVAIAVKGAGTVTVVYNEDGNIADVTSDGDATLVTTITRTFGRLTELARAAGVSLDL